MPLGDAATTDEILSRYLRIARALGTRYEEAAAAGNLEKARQLRAEMDTVTERARQWSINAPKIREAEGWVQPAVFQATVRQFFTRFWDLVKRELLARNPDALPALESVQSSLPTILPSELGTLS